MWPSNSVIRSPQFASYNGDVSPSGALVVGDVQTRSQKPFVRLSQAERPCVAALVSKGVRGATWQARPVHCSDVSSVTVLVATGRVCCHSTDEAAEAERSSATCHLGGKPRNRTYTLRARARAVRSAAPPASPAAGRASWCFLGQAVRAGSAPGSAVA